MRASPDVASDWRTMMRDVLPSVLIAGPAGTVERSLAAVVPPAAPGVYHWTPDTLLPSPIGLSILVIRNVDALSAEHQRQLSSWFEQAAVCGTRVVSTTSVPLFQRVSEGLFLEGLYYRLNAVLLSYTDVAGPADLPAEKRWDAFGPVSIGGLPAFPS